MGAGRTEMTRALFGFDRRTSGTVSLDGKPIEKDSPVAARRAGLGLVTENRKEDGILPTLSVKKNVSIVTLDQVSRWIRINRRKEIQEVRRISEAISRTPASVVPASSERWPARWITGPSAIGSENGTPNSIRSAPPRTRAETSAGVRFGQGSPAVM
jgi:ABC-type Fe3+/spermidine/putrescine transport system ATPase subunit